MTETTKESRPTRPPARPPAPSLRALPRGVRGGRRLQALAGQDRDRGGRPPVLPDHDEPPPAAPQRRLRARVPAGPQRGGGPARLLAGARDVGERRVGQGDRQPRHRGAVAPGARSSTATRCSPRARCSTCGRPSPSRTAAWCACTRASTSRTARWWRSSSAPCWSRASADRLAASGAAPPAAPRSCAACRRRGRAAVPTPTRLIELVSTSARWAGEASQERIVAADLRLERVVHRERLAAVRVGARHRDRRAVLKPSWEISQRAKAPAERCRLRRGAQRPQALARARLVDLGDHRGSAARRGGSRRATRRARAAQASNTAMLACLNRLSL